MKREMQLLLKPVSAQCNMRCGYCFYKDEAMHRKTFSYGTMTQETMQRVVKNALQSARSCVFGFQGGEPTLAGLDFYRAFVSYAEKMKRPGQKISYTLQTNGLALNEEWALFLKEKGFLTGISMDGNRELNDWNRKDIQGKGTLGRVLKNAKMLQRYGVPVNVLCVLTRQNARKIRSVYSFFKKNGFLYQQYLPCMEPLDQREKEALSAVEYGEALKELFDLWFEDILKGTPVFVRHMDNWLHMLRGGQPDGCAMYGSCAMQNIVEADGSVYPCDFYVMDGFCMGNARETDFETIWKQAEGPGAAGFFREASRRDERCRECKWYPLCRGGCRRDCVQSGDTLRNRYCEAYQMFFSYAIERLEWLAARQ